jgi:putative ABC transport system substrate-binding protein
MNSAKAALFVLVGLGVLLMPPVAVEAQQAGKVWRIGFLGMAPATVYAPYVAAFKADLLNFGYVEGRNIAIEYRWAEGKYERLPALASELVRRNMDVILTHGTPATRAAKDATASIPIIMISIADPVASGLVASLARPGGNVTGLSNQAAGVISKHVELLIQIAPESGVLAVLQNLTNPGATAPQLKEVEAAARTRGLRVQLFGVGAPSDFDTVFARIGTARTAGVVVLSDPIFIDQRSRIAELAGKNRVPTVFSRSENVDAGGLMSYGPSLIGQFRQAVTYVDKIFKGAKAGDLPVEQPTKLELSVNLKTAKALGLSIPQSILVRADRVIE